MSFEDYYQLKVYWTDDSMMQLNFPYLFNKSNPLIFNANILKGKPALNDMIRDVNGVVGKISGITVNEKDNTCTLKVERHF